jgi:hypothetical protein
MRRARRREQGEREVRRCAWRVLGVAMGERAGQRMHASNTHKESADFSALYYK